MKMNPYIKTLLALTSLTISASFFGFLRTLSFSKYGPNLFTYIFIVCWLLLNAKIGFRLWVKK